MAWGYRLGNYDGSQEVIVTAFHEAGHAVMTMLRGYKWTSCRVCLFKREVEALGVRGHCQFGGIREPEGMDDALIAAAGHAATSVWKYRRDRLYRSKAATAYPPDFDQHFVSDRDLERAGEDHDEAHQLGYLLLLREQKILSWIARRLVRQGYTHSHDLRQNLPLGLRRDYIAVSQGYGLAWTQGPGRDGIATVSLCRYKN
jgi:hypothetical protein